MKSKRYDVLLSYTKADIKAEALRAWIHKKKWWWIGFIAVSLIYMIVITASSLHGNVYAVILAGYMLIGVAVVSAQQYRIGNKVWNKLKDSPEPIDLRNIKEML